MKSLTLSHYVNNPNRELSNLLIVSIAVVVAPCEQAYNRFRSCRTKIDRSLVEVELYKHYAVSAYERRV